MGGVGTQETLGRLREQWEHLGTFFGYIPPSLKDPEDLGFTALNPKP